MGETEYLEALKIGKKEYKTCMAQGRFPYLPVLDEILSQSLVQTEKKLGLVHVPLDKVVGTSTMGRTYSFAANFMPILPQKSEFALKWAHLSDAQIDEGIRDPIIAYEYMNRYYVVEGNKRVSVLKYFNAVSIPAIVTRKIPVYSEEDADIRLYYEYMNFNEITGLNTIDFTKAGKAQKLLDMVGCDGAWDDKTREDFGKILFYFSKAYEFHGGKKLPISIGDALAAFMGIYGYEELLAMEEDAYHSNVEKAWNEFVLLSGDEQVDLVMDPATGQEKKSLLSYLLPASSKKYTAAFLYPRDPETSKWIYGHELGRNYLEEMFPEQLKTICVNDVNEENIEEVLNDVIEQGANIVFEITPQMMEKSLKVALEHPDVKIFNCSVNTPHQYIRTYYARMYEAKFISGMVAGALAENDRIGYIADYPIFGMIANINAFALGAQCVNPRAKIYLEWSTRKDFNQDEFLWNNELRYVSDQDMITPSEPSRKFGVYRYEPDGTLQNLVMPLWNWGIFYEKIIQSILAGSYENESKKVGKAMNYWWGMSAGVIDVIFSKLVPNSVKRLARHVKNDLRQGDMVPFFGEIYSQDKTLRNRENEAMSPEAIMKMDWLAENVVGEIPPIEELKDTAHSIVHVKGVEENKDTEG